MENIFFNPNNFYFIILIIFFLGGVVKGAIGVGLPTITIGLLTFFFDIKECIPLILLSVVFTNLFQAFEGHNFKIVIKDNLYFLFFSSLFIIPGIFLLKTLNSQIIIIFLAILIISNSVLYFFKKTIKINNHSNFNKQLFLGLINGLVVGMTGIYSMPFIFLIQSLNYKKEKLIQLMGITFFLYSLIQIIFFNLFNLYDADIFIQSLIYCFPVILGNILGRFIRKKLSENIFKTLFNGMLLIIGISIFIKTFI
jgi:hypothetical protein